jgi:predicted RNase H-like HicB family nuclease
VAGNRVSRVDGVARTIDAYTVVIRPDDNGTFVAYVPAIDGCHAWGRTPDEARAELANVFEMIADEHARSGRSLPPDVELTITRAS